MKIHCKTSWNTGRLYREDGQPITAWLITMGREDLIYFSDQARMIDGLIPVLSLQRFVGYGKPDSMVKEYVQFMYDRGQYTMLLHHGDEDESSPISSYHVKALLKAEEEANV